MPREVLLKEDQFEIHGAHDHRELIDEVNYVRVRSRGGHTKEDKIDSYSSHYCAMQDGEPVVVIRITHARNGPLECEEYYPNGLDRLRPILASSSRFYARADIKIAPQLPVKLLKACWASGLLLGARVDITNCHLRGLLYYSRLGYVSLSNGRFIHPTLGTPSQAIALPADPRQASVFQDVFADVLAPLSVEDLDLIVPLERARPSAARIAALKRLPRQGTGTCSALASELSTEK